MDTVSVVLSVKPDQVKAFEAGFREHELPIWEDYHARGVMLNASIAKMDISSVRRGDAVQYLICVVFADGEGHPPRQRSALQRVEPHRRRVPGRRRDGVRR